MELNNINPLPGFLFYPDDFTGDTALMSCSLAAIGVWSILLCRMHKAPVYGYLTLLKQNPEQKPKQTEIVAEIVALKGDKLARIVGRPLAEIEPLLEELLDAGVMKIDPDTKIFYCKRMVNDHDLRLKRKEAGAAGGRKTQEKNKPFAKANQQAGGEQNAGNENGNENETVIENAVKKKRQSRSKKQPAAQEEPVPEKTIHGKVMDLYFEFFRAQAGTDPKITGRDGKAVKDLIAHFASIARNGQQITGEKEIETFVIQCLGVIFQSWNLQEEFIKKQIDLYQISNNVNRIIFRLKTLQNERTNQTGGNSVVGTGKTNPGNISDETLFASISAKFGGK